MRQTLIQCPPNDSRRLYSSHLHRFFYTILRTKGLVGIGDLLPDSEGRNRRKRQQLGRAKETVDALATDDWDDWLEQGVRSNDALVEAMRD